MSIGGKERKIMRLPMKFCRTSLLYNILFVTLRVETKPYVRMYSVCGTKKNIKTR